MSGKTLTGSVFRKSTKVGASSKNLKEDDEKKTLIDGAPSDDINPDEVITTARPDFRTINLRQMHKGQYLGEISLITNMRRTASCTAINYVTLASISREDFDILKEEYPSIY